MKVVGKYSNYIKLLLVILVFFSPYLGFESICIYLYTLTPLLNTFHLHQI